MAKRKPSRKTRKEIASPSRKFECIFCSKVLTKLNYMHMHINRHTGERPYQCEQCFQDFPDTRDLSTHRNIVHQGKYPTCKCDKCKYVTRFRGNLHWHKKLHHEDSKEVKGHTKKNIKMISQKSSAMKARAGALLKSIRAPVNRNTGSENNAIEDEKVSSSKNTVSTATNSTPKAEDITAAVEANDTLITRNIDKPSSAKSSLLRPSQLFNLMKSLEHVSKLKRKQDGLPNNESNESPSSLPERVSS